MFVFVSNRLQEQSQRLACLSNVIKRVLVYQTVKHLAHVAAYLTVTITALSCCYTSKIQTF